MWSINDAPYELADAVREFWDQSEWDNAVSISHLESNWNAFAVDDTRTPALPCGSFLRSVDGVDVFTELSVGFFQINACNFPGWEWQRFYNARHNAGTAHLLWTFNGWKSWYFSAKQLGLI